MITLENNSTTIWGILLVLSSCNLVWKGEYDTIFEESVAYTDENSSAVTRNHEE